MPPNQFDTVLSNVQRVVPDCVAVGLVDLASGLLLGSKTVDSHPAQVLALVAGATSEMFQGPTISEIERQFRVSRGHKEDSEHYQERRFLEYEPFALRNAIEQESEHGSNGCVQRRRECRNGDGEGDY